MNGRNFAIVVALIGLAGPSVRAAEPLSSDGLLAGNLSSFLNWEPMDRFKADEGRMPAFVSVYLHAPPPEPAGAPPEPPRPDPNGGGGGGRAY